MKKIIASLGVVLGSFILPLLAWASVVDYDASLYSEVYGTGLGYNMGARDIVVGDFNGDGKSDFAVDSGSSVYIILGSTTPITNGSITKAARYSITKTDEYTSIFQKAAGDINGDGYDDLAIFAYSYGNTKIHIFYGAKTLPTGDVSINTSNIKIGVNDFMSHVAIGDLDNNGKADLLISEYVYDTDKNYHTPDLGIVYGFYNDTLNSATSTLPLSSADFKIVGQRPEGIYAWFGNAMKVADIDDDGQNDLLIGAYQYNEAGYEEPDKPEGYGEGVRMGAVYVIYGDNTKLNGDLNVADIMDARFTGDYHPERQIINEDGEELGWEYKYDELGSDIMTGDINGDNKTDLILGAFTRSDFGEYGGALYIIYGTGDKLEGEKPIKSNYNVLIQPSMGNEPNIGNYGWTSIGDVDNDGADDILFNGFSDDHGNRSMALIYGRTGSDELLGEVSAESADMIYHFKDDTYNGTLLDLNGDGNLDFIFGSGNDDTYTTAAGLLYISYAESDFIGAKAVAAKKGMIKIYDAHGNITKKRIFAATSGKVRIVSYRNYYIILEQKGRQIAVLDASFNILTILKISNIKWKYNNLQVFDLKHDGKLDIIATKKRANNQVRTQTFFWNDQTKKIIKHSGKTKTMPTAAVSQTLIQKSKIIIRNINKEILQEYSVLKSGNLK